MRNCNSRIRVGIIVDETRELYVVLYVIDRDNMLISVEKNMSILSFGYLITQAHNNDGALAK